MMSSASRLTLNAVTLALLIVPSLGLADADRLEADLRALFGADGAFEVGNIAEGTIRDRTIAEAIRFQADEGERLLIDRYVVNGDYDQPDEVTIEGVRLEDSLTEVLLMSVERIVLDEPSQAVFPLGGSEPGEIEVGRLTIDDIVIDLGSEFAAELFDDPSLEEGEGSLAIELVRGESLSHQAIGMVEVIGVKGVSQDLGELGSGSFSLSSLHLEGLSGLDEEMGEGENEQQLDRFELNDLVVDAERFVGSLAHLSLDGDFSDGQGGLEIDAFQADLARMIELAPEEERAQLRMASNVLTDGSGELRIDAALLGNWEQGEMQSLITSDSHVTIHDALRLLVDVELPVVLSEGVTPAAVFADAGVLESAKLLGGNLRLILNEQGLLGRLTTLGAAMEGITESQYIEQARTQAEGFGMMFGPEVQQFLLGLVSLAEGAADELEVAVTLPAESNLETYTGDPMGLPERLEMRVETR
ncbi:hypothetical protein [Halomonas daqiaonensis]|uniref:Uncharacterized protein n=1 Tax=Halomonas daqiaonensis TaxID=650850 RepID=A0A1H7M6U1_9GAMM|nr:hypothetical protein [Halomonas daqiaonensis]SEL06465.1 hypothetical protein SAMN04488129_106142 [Halomonas daqiaonensis]